MYLRVRVQRALRKVPWFVEEHDDVPLLEDVARLAWLCVDFGVCRVDGACSVNTGAGGWDTGARGGDTGACGGDTSQRRVEAHNPHVLLRRGLSFWACRRHQSDRQHEPSFRGASR